MKDKWLRNIRNPDFHAKGSTDETRVAKVWYSKNFRNEIFTFFGKFRFFYERKITSTSNYFQVADI